MSPPISKPELDEIARLVAKQLAAKEVPRPGPGLHSTARGPSGADAMRAVSDSKLDFEDRAMSHERFMRDVVGRLEQRTGNIEKKIDKVVDSIPPAAIAAEGAKDAAVAGEKASGAAKKSSRRAMIVSVVQGTALGLYGAYEVLKHFGLVP